MGRVKRDVCHRQRASAGGAFFFTLAVGSVFAENFLCNVSREMRKPSKWFRLSEAGKGQKVCIIPDLRGAGMIS